MEMLIVDYPWAIYTVLLDDKRNIIEIASEVEDLSGIGNIIVGRIDQVKKNINSAFVRISEDEKVFLSLQESVDAFYTKKVGKGDNPVQGDELLVQIEKEAHKTKLAKATASLVLPGRYTVLTTDQKKIFVSSKINDQNLRKRYKAIYRNMITDRYGFIIRTNACQVTEDVIRQEMVSLSREFDEMLAGIVYKPLYSRLNKPVPNYMKKLRDLSSTDSMKVTLCNETIADKLSEFIRNQGIRAELNVLKSEEPEDLINAYGIRDKLKKLTQKKVWLKSGATIVIDPTEAMTVIDVNTERSLSRKNSSDTILKTNLEAADEIMKQIRARNISGIVIVDFIDMKDHRARTQLIRHVDDACRKMPIKTTLHGMTNLGLMEITRKKLEKPIRENEQIAKLTEP